MRFFERLALARKRAGLTQRHVAEAMRVSTQAVSQWEKGQVAIKNDRIPDLAQVLGVDVQWLETGDISSAPLKSRGFPQELMEQQNYGNVPSNVFDLDDIPLLVASLNRMNDEIDQSLVKDVIFVKYPTNKRTFSIRIYSDIMQPDLVSGDIAVFGIDEKAEVGDIVICVISFNDFFQVGFSRPEEQKLLAAVVRMGGPTDRWGDQMIVSTTNVEVPESARPSFFILGPLVERRTRLRK